MSLSVSVKISVVIIRLHLPNAAPLEESEVSWAFNQTKLKIRKEMSWLNCDFFYAAWVQVAYKQNTSLLHVRGIGSDIRMLPVTLLEKLWTEMKEKVKRISLYFFLLGTQQNQKISVKVPNAIREKIARV